MLHHVHREKNSSADSLAARGSPSLWKDLSCFGELWLLEFDGSHNRRRGTGGAGWLLRTAQAPPGAIIPDAGMLQWRTAMAGADCLPQCRNSSHAERVSLSKALAHLVELVTSVATTGGQVTMRGNSL